VVIEPTSPPARLWNEEPIDPPRPSDRTLLPTVISPGESPLSARQNISFPDSALMSMRAMLGHLPRLRLREPSIGGTGHP